MGKRYSNHYLVCALNDIQANKIAEKNEFDLITYTKREFRDGSHQFEFKSFDESQILETDCAILYYRFKKPLDSDVINVLRLLHYLKDRFRHVVLLAPFMPFLREHSDQVLTYACFLFYDIKIIISDGHASRDNVISLPPTEFAEYIKRDDLIILPDDGASRYLGMYQNDHIHGVKDRNSGLSFSDASKIYGRNCVILDDIVDTGYTLINTIKQLKLHRANLVKACVTHYLAQDLILNGADVGAFSKWGLEFLYIYDTVLGDKQVDCAQICDFTTAFTNLKEKL